MLTKTILILMFLLFAWWFARFTHRDGYQGRTASRQHEQYITDTPKKVDPLTEDSPPTASGLSFRPDGNLKTSLSSDSSEEPLSHSAQRLRATDSGPGNSTEFKSIAAASGITGDEQQEFVASLLRQIDENNRDITLLSAGAQENDELIARVSLQDTQIVELREQLDALEFESTVAFFDTENTGKSPSSQPDETLVNQQHAERLETLKEELAANQASLSSLRSQLIEAQQEAAKHSENDLEMRRLRSELESVQRERDQRIASLEAQLSGPGKKTNTGSKLKPLFTPPAGYDDLKKIKGIGP